MKRQAALNVKTIAAIEMLQQWSAARVIAATMALLVVVLGIEILTGYEVTVAQLFLAPVAVAAVGRGMRAAALTSAVTTLLGFWVDVNRAPVDVTIFVIVCNWTLRGASFIAFAQVLVSLCNRVARETFAARTDGLTGAPNRVAFRESLDDEVARAVRAGSSLALCYVDLDKFKVVNDELGHDEGDRVLRAIVATASAALRQSDQVFRLGGDEFAWLLPAANPVQARAISERVLAAWEQETDARGWPVRLSIGLAVLNPGHGGSEVLVKTADAAMYAAKRAGGNRVHLVQMD